MATRRRRKSKSLSAKYMELAIAVPQVVAHRATRVALAGPIPSDRDRREFQRMVVEKQAAFAQAWWAMALQMYRVNQELISLTMRALVTPLSLYGPSAASTVAKTQRAMTKVLDKGLAPVHRSAVSNAERLSKTSFR